MPTMRQRIEDIIRKVRTNLKWSNIVQTFKNLSNPFKTAKIKDPKTPLTSATKTVQPTSPPTKQEPTVDLFASLSPLERMQKYYQEKTQTFLETKPDGIGPGTRARFFNDPKTPYSKIKTVNGLSEEAQKFTQITANEMFNRKDSMFSPPYTEENLTKMSELFTKLNQDLTGNVSGSPAQQEQANKWNHFWQEVKTTHNIDDETLTKLQDDFLASYRYQTLQLVSIEGMKNEMDNAKLNQWRSIELFVQTANSQFKGESKHSTTKFNDAILNSMTKKTGVTFKEEQDRFIEAAKNKNIDGMVTAFGQICQSHLALNFEAERNEAFENILKHLPDQKTLTEFKEKAIQAKNKDNKLMLFLDDFIKKASPTSVQPIQTNQPTPQETSTPKAKKTVTWWDDEKTSKTSEPPKPPVTTSFSNHRAKTKEKEKPMDKQTQQQAITDELKEKFKTRKI